jgi:predicted GIY-YIG superfamily endonuclease
MSDLRNHFVYTAFDADGDALYVGCTKNLDERMKAHRYGSDWFYKAERFHLRGPYTYTVARQIEREQLALLRPLYASHPTRVTHRAVYNRIQKREYRAQLDRGVELEEAIRTASEVASQYVKWAGWGEPLRVTDAVLAEAFAAERRYLTEREQVAS